MVSAKLANPVQQADFAGMDEGEGWVNLHFREGRTLLPCPATLPRLFTQVLVVVV